VEEAEGMRLRDLAMCINSRSNFAVWGISTRGWCRRLSRSPADGLRTDTANARSNLRHLGEIAAFAEFFKPAKLHHVKSRIRDFTRLVEVDRDLRVSLDARDGMMVMTLLLASVITKSPLAQFGTRPASSSVSAYQIVSASVGSQDVGVHFDNLMDRTHAYQ